MAKKTWNKTSAFEFFGVSPDNVRWGWSGISKDGETVALVLWQDLVERDGASLVYRDDKDLAAAWRKRPGATSRTRHLQHCVEQLDGKFRAVIAKAVDVEADPRSIASCFPQEGVLWKIDSFDQQSGAFTASVDARG